MVQLPHSSPPYSQTSGSGATGFTQGQWASGATSGQGALLHATRTKAASAKSCLIRPGMGQF